jgi:hypothetical protein
LLAPQGAYLGSEAGHGAQDLLDLCVVAATYFVP